jgi:pyridoxamine 5'-phosphate oxidase
MLEEVARPFGVQVTMSPSSLRREYSRESLDESALHPDPIEQYRAWFEDAVAASVLEPNAMTLATATPDGRPSARVVLLKSFDERGFTFHTNHESRKGRELSANPQAALVLYWAPLERQVRIEGRVERVSDQESDEYFRTRPLGARLAAWVSRQSEVVGSRADLEARLHEVEQQYLETEAPRPPHWGGCRVVPDAFEFWQGRPNRLHDRFRYRLSPTDTWVLERLAP